MLMTTRHGDSNEMVILSSNEAQLMLFDEHNVDTHCQLSVNSSDEGG